VEPKSEAGNSPSWRISSEIDDFVRSPGFSGVQTGCWAFGKFFLSQDILREGVIMEFLFFLGIIAFWLLLQIWILPKFGVST
jgi:hypothetical protein